MSDLHREEYERFRNFWSQYGSSIIVGLLLSLSLSFGLHFWKKRQALEGYNASMHYQMMLAHVGAEEQVKASEEAHLLQKQHAQTPYAVFASFFLAKEAVFQERYGDAERELSWAMRSASSNILKQVARLRLARVQLAQGKSREALELLRVQDDPSFAAEVSLIQGHAYLKQGDKARAREAYQKAQESLPKDALYAPLLQMVLDDLS